MFILIHSFTRDVPYIFSVLKIENDEWFYSSSFIFCFRLFNIAVAVAKCCSASKILHEVGECTFQQRIWWLLIHRLFKKTLNKRRRQREKSVFDIHILIITCVLQFLSGLKWIAKMNWYWLWSWHVHKDVRFFEVDQLVKSLCVHLQCSQSFFIIIDINLLTMSNYTDAL